MARKRLDAELVRRELLNDTETAAELIAAGRVSVNGAIAAKPTRLVEPGDAVRIEPPAARFVSRGGIKLDAALDQFDLDVAGRRVLDAGASTGGFTDCVLQRGARHVVALDVGRGQLDSRLRDDDRVTVLEKTHVRDATPELIGGRVSLIVADLSFISLASVARPLVGCAAPGADLVMLVKPQFEADRAEADRGRGVITDPAVWRAALRSVIDAFVAEQTTIMGAIASPIRGARGNVEFVVHMRVDPDHRPDAPVDRERVDALIDELIDETVRSALEPGGEPEIEA